MMTPFELIDLSMTSSRTKRSVIIFSRLKPRFRVSLRFWFEPDIIIGGHRKEWRYSWTSDRYKDRPTTRYIFSKNQFKDCMNWFESMKEVIGGRICSMAVLRMDMLITDWLRLQQNSIENVKIGIGRPEHVKYFLETIRVTGIFDLMIAMSEKDSLFEFPEGSYTLLMEYICFEQLLRINSPKIILRHSYFKNREINGFLKNWMACESHLELFGINLSGPEAVNEIMDLPYEVTTDPDVLKKFKDYSFYPNVTRAFKIKRYDGKIAIVCVGYQKIFDLPWVYSLCMVIH
uniref:FBA_2 domain-containing protein n=1 Tax=Caenorhabditis tropicalis TaxID=1561998 RepID=A0A1I7TH95_9PELO